MNQLKQYRCDCRHMEVTEHIGRIWDHTHTSLLTTCATCTALCEVDQSLNEKGIIQFKDLIAQRTIIPVIRKTITVSSLLDKDYQGIVAQVTNPVFISPNTPPMWRTLLSVSEELDGKSKGMFLIMRWQKRTPDDIAFSGVLNSPAHLKHFKIELATEDYNRLFK